MLTFKRNIYSAVCKRQTEEAMMRQIDDEIREKEEQYEEDLNKDWEERPLSLAVAEGYGQKCRLLLLCLFWD